MFWLLEPSIYFDKGAWFLASAPSKLSVFNFMFRYLFLFRDSSFWALVLPEDTQ